MSDVNLYFTKEDQTLIIDLKSRGKTIDWLAQKFKVHSFKINAVLNEYSNSRNFEKWEEKFYNFPMTREAKYLYDEKVNEMDCGTYVQITEKDLCFSESNLFKDKQHNKLKQIG